MIYQEYLNAFLARFDYPEDARTDLGAALDTLLACPEAKDTLNALLASYAVDPTVDFSVLAEKCEVITRASGLHCYVTDLLVLILLSMESQAHYAAAGIDEDMWQENMMDIKYKAVECKLIKGIWGTFVFAWFSRFFHVTRFSFGPLQFETVKLRKPYTKNGVTYPVDTVAVNVHIPRTGKRLTPALAEDSFRAAEAFFKDRYGISPVIFVCESWLLFPRNLSILKPESNLYSFISRFEVIESGEYDTYGSVWRLFDADYNGNPDALPQDTSLRRAYVEIMKKGEPLGWAYGAFILE